MTAFAIDTYVVDSLLPDLVGHDHQPSAFLIFLFLWRHTHGRGASDVQVSLVTSRMRPGSRNDRNPYHSQAIP